MLSAFLAYLLLSGGGHSAELGTLSAKYLKPHVERTVADEARRKEALRALSTMTKHIERLNDRMEKDLGAFQKLVQDYGSKPEDVDRLSESAAAADLSRADEIWKDRAELLSHVRPEEWSAIVAGAHADMAKDAAKAHEEKAK